MTSCPLLVFNTSNSVTLPTVTDIFVTYIMKFIKTLLSVIKLSSMHLQRSKLFLRIVYYFIYHPTPSFVHQSSLLSRLYKYRYLLRLTAHDTRWKEGCGMGELKKIIIGIRDPGHYLNSNPDRFCR